MLYEIRENSKYNSREIYFNEIPPYEVRNALKELDLRWNRKKACWYGFAKEHEIIDAIQNNSDNGAVVTDGYMGGKAFYGANSNKNLYGADLSKAIREAIKAAGIKGVTVRCHTYSMGQSIYATVKTTEKDFTDRDEYINAYDINKAAFGRIWTGESNVDLADYYNMTGEEQQQIRTAAATATYEKAMNGLDISEYHIDTYTEFTDAFRGKLNAVNDIIRSFRYDESNSMVDYHNTNFYYNIATKAVA